MLATISMQCNKYTLHVPAPFYNFFPADVCGQQDFDPHVYHNCQQLRAFINNRDYTRVTNCKKADDCLSFTCNVSVIGNGEVTIEVSLFPACKRPVMVGVTVNLASSPGSQIFN